jgi:hypothetical protein
MEEGAEPTAGEDVEEGAAPTAGGDGREGLKLAQEEEGKK